MSFLKSSIERLGLSRPGRPIEGESDSAAEAAPGEIRRLLSRFDEISQSERRWSRETLGRFVHGGETYSIPRYTFRGPGSVTMRLGLFAVIHGDEPEGGLALARLAGALTARPALATGYELTFYPLCNPTGLEDGTRFSRSGKDLNREFWIGSALPEVRLIERELLTHRFDGLVALHTDDTADGTYGFVRGKVLSAALLEPALAAASRYVPRSQSSRIDGFEAERGIIYRGYEGILSAASGLRPEPFEIVFETPGTLDRVRQIQAAEAALLAIMERFREFIAFANGI